MPELPELSTIPIVICEDAPDVGALTLVHGDDCPYCGKPISDHDLEGADTKDMRRIETEAGTIVGEVDRVIRKVRWHLECPECETSIPFTDETFRGQAPIVCECGWASRPIGHKDRSEGGSVYAYHNYSDLAFGEGAGCATDGEGVHAGMGF